MAVKIDFPRGNAFEKILKQNKNRKYDTEKQGVNRSV